MKKRAFVIVEVLVAFIILTTTMSLLTYSQKNFNENVKKLDYYENIYITLLSLKNKIDIELQLGDKEYYEGKLNGINYKINLKKIKEDNNYEYDEIERKVIKGFHTYILYKVDIKLYEVGKTYTFYKIRYYIDPIILEQLKNEV